MHVSTLTLVRHGQASFFADDYDRLSTVGEAQATLLGEYWVRQGEVFSEVYVGPLRRQQQTAELVGAAFQRAGVPWPEPLVFSELQEYDLTGLLGQLGPELALRDTAFAELVKAYQKSEEDRERTRAFQKLFETLLTHWQSAQFHAEFDLLESWPRFRDRVWSGLCRITEASRRGRRVAVFTSGGFIGAAVARVLDAPDRSALELNWRVRNASLTNLLFTPGRLTLDDFNTIPHLPDTAYWTYR
jgi:broad specificity phosphatase PhoE